MTTSRPARQPKGYGGKKYAYADAIEFIPVPDEAARVAGLQAGDYHIGLDIGNDQYEVLKDYPGVIAEILTPTELGCLLPELEIADDGEPGHAPGRAGGDATTTPQLQSGRGGGEFIRLDPGLMMQQTAWYTDGRRGALQRQRSGRWPRPSCRRPGTTASRCAS